ncbi:hypothetical protein Sjap_022348 [Stephania japonica]|uniref:Uncharacterized protein n=1 Tax=Stephania japonica TaxID=461633 RepID=A0AAP0EP83_9MAGN
MFKRASSIRNPDTHGDRPVAIVVAVRFDLREAPVAVGVDLRFKGDAPSAVLLGVWKLLSVDVLVPDGATGPPIARCCSTSSAIFNTDALFPTLGGKVFHALMTSMTCRSTRHGKDKDITGYKMPNLVYIAREKRSHVHDYEMEDGDADHVESDFNFPSENHDHKHRVAERMLGWHMTYGRGEINKELSPPPVGGATQTTWWWFPLLERGSSLRTQLLSPPPVGGATLTTWWFPLPEGGACLRSWSLSQPLADGATLMTWCSPPLVGGATLHFWQALVSFETAETREETWTEPLLWSRPLEIEVLHQRLAQCEAIIESHFRVHMDSGVSASRVPLPPPPEEQHQQARMEPTDPPE